MPEKRLQRTREAYKYICKECQEAFNSKEELDKHLAELKKK